MKTKFDIFISYRRDGGLEMADSIYQRLINAGYSVFLDLEQLNSGKFNTKLISVIEQCRDFIIVLPLHALERCNEEDDWVRQEIECALANKKNIIPIMLRGFEWPAKDSLPESLRDLPNYNGISASDHNIFVESIERLKNSFLLSKPGITWKRYKKHILCIIAFLLLVTGIAFGIRFNNHKQYVSLCNEISMNMILEVGKLNNNILVAEDILESWEQFVNGYDDEELPYLKKELNMTVDYARENMQELKLLQLTEKEISILRKNNIEIEEIDAFSAFAAYVQDDINSFFNVVEMFSEMSINDYMKKTPEYSYKSLVISLKALYYGTLSMFKTMPITIYDKLHQTSPQMSLLSDIPLSNSKEDYDALQKGAMIELERIVEKMRVRTNELEREVEQMEFKQEKMEKELNEMFVGN